MSERTTARGRTLFLVPLIGITPVAFALIGTGFLLLMFYLKYLEHKAINPESASITSAFLSRVDDISLLFLVIGIMTGLLLAWPLDKICRGRSFGRMVPFGPLSTLLYMILIPANLLVYFLAIKSDGGTFFWAIGNGREAVLNGRPFATEVAAIQVMEGMVNCYALVLWAAIGVVAINSASILAETTTSQILDGDDDNAKRHLELASNQLFYVCLFPIILLNAVGITALWIHISRQLDDPARALLNCMLLWIPFFICTLILFGKRREQIKLPLSR